MGKLLVIKNADFYANALDYSKVWTDITSDFVDERLDYGYYGKVNDVYSVDGRTDLEHKAPGGQGATDSFIKTYVSNTTMIDSETEKIRVTIPSGYSIRLIACRVSTFPSKTSPSSCYRTGVYTPAANTVYDEDDVLPSLSNSRYWGFNINKNNDETPLNVENLVSAGFKVEELV